MKIDKLIKNQLYFYPLKINVCTLQIQNITYNFSLCQLQCPFINDAIILFIKTVTVKNYVLSTIGYFKKVNEDIKQLFSQTKPKKQFQFTCISSTSHNPKQCLTRICFSKNLKEEQWKLLFHNEAIHQTWKQKIQFLKTNALNQTNKIYEIEGYQLFSKYEENQEENYKQIRKLPVNLVAKIFTMKNKIIIKEKQSYQLMKIQYQEAIHQLNGKNVQLCGSNQQKRCQLESLKCQYDILLRKYQSQKNNYQSYAKQIKQPQIDATTQQYKICAKINQIKTENQIIKSNIRTNLAQNHPLILQNQQLKGKIHQLEHKVQQFQQINDCAMDQTSKFKQKLLVCEKQIQTKIRQSKQNQINQKLIKQNYEEIIKKLSLEIQQIKENSKGLAQNMEKEYIQKKDNKVCEEQQETNKQQKLKNIDIKGKAEDQQIKNNCKLDIQSIKTQYLKNIEKEKEKIEELIAEITELRRENSEIKEENKQLQKNFRNEQKQCLKLKQQNQQLIIQLQTTTEKIALLRREKQSGEYLHIFEGETIRNRDIQAKQFLRRSIEEYMNRTIEYTRKVYKYDTLNKISFHSYVDGVPFLCTVIRTVNDDLLAAFSVDPLRSNVVTGSRGLLVSMTNSTVYRCQQGRRSMTYDDFFFIYGNSEMRIRMGDNKLFSNFGMNGGSFESRGDSVGSYIGSNTNRETKFVTYEVYEIIFNEE